MKTDRTIRTTTIEIGVTSDIITKIMFYKIVVVDGIEVKGFQLVLDTVMSKNIFINARHL